MWPEAEWNWLSHTIVRTIFTYICKDNELISEWAPFIVLSLKTFKTDTKETIEHRTHYKAIEKRLKYMFETLT